MNNVKVDETLLLHKHKYHHRITIRQGPKVLLVPTAINSSHSQEFMV